MNATRVHGNRRTLLSDVVVSMRIGCTLILLSQVGMMQGCTLVGPASIKSGRMVYSETITATDQEQMLRAIVRDRYEESIALLSVASITANVSTTRSIGINAGIGADSGYAGRLVPFSAGVVYEENPTISYLPVDTPAYLQQLLSPVPLDTTLLILRSSSNQRLVILSLFERINGLKNSNRRVSENNIKDFEQAASILEYLLSRDFAEFVAIGKSEFGLLIQVEELRQQDQKEKLITLMKLLELKDLLSEVSFTGDLPSGRITGEEDVPNTKADEGDPSRGDETKDQMEKRDTDKDEEGGLATVDTESVERSEKEVLVIPIRFSAVSDGSTLAFTTYSVYDLIRNGAASVDVPDEHIQSGMARDLVQKQVDGDMFRINRSESRPVNALVATFVHGWWYYIDNLDVSSKQSFRLISTLWLAQLASANRGAAAPLLTVPVSK